MIRSDVQNYPSENDIQFLKSHRITTVIDMRGEKDVARKPGGFADSSEFRYHNIQIDEGSDVPENYEAVPVSYMKIAERGFVSSDREFYHMCVNDLEALDAYLLESRPELDDLFIELTSKEADYYLPDWIEKQYMENSIWWWKNHYLPGIKKRELLYIATEDIEEFIVYSVDKIAEELSEVLLVEN